MDSALGMATAVAGVAWSILHSVVLANVLLLCLLLSVASRLDKQEVALRGIYRRLNLRGLSSRRAVGQRTATDNSWDEYSDDDDGDDDEECNEDDDPSFPPLSESVREEIAVRRGDLPAPAPWWRQHLLALIVLAAVGIPSLVAWAWLATENCVAIMTLVSLGFAALLWLRWTEYKRAEFKALGKPVPWWAQERKG